MSKIITMKITQRQLKKIINEVLLNEGFIDDASDYIASTIDDVSDAASEFFDNVSDFFNSLIKDLTEYGRRLVSNLKKDASEEIELMLVDEASQSQAKELIKHFASQDELKKLLKENSKKPEKIDALFRYLANKGVDLEDLTLKMAGKLIMEGVLEIDGRKTPPVVFKKDKDSAVVVADALIESLEELNANMGMDFFGIRVGKKLEARATKLILKNRLVRLFKN